MSARKRAPAHVSHERWLVSYADFITLMFAFFVVMFSSARMDKHRSAQLAEAIQSAFQQLGTLSAMKPVGRSATLPAQTSGDLIPAVLSQTHKTESNLANMNYPPDDFAAIRQQLEKLLAPEIQRHEVAFRMKPEGLVVSLQEIGFFDSGSAQIKTQAMDALGRVATFLHNRSCMLRVEGHTDTVPIHNQSFASNWELSTARAAGLVRILIEKYGFSPASLSAAGYGEYHPVADNSTPEGQQLNRRVDIVILSAPIILPSDKSKAK